MQKILITVLIAFSVIPVISYAKEDALKKGEAIYSKHCAMCHLPELAGAPKVHDQTAWKTRFEQAQTTAKQEDPTLTGETLGKKAMEALIDTVKKGKNAMPPGGMCDKCTDADYESAIRFMMSKG